MAEGGGAEKPLDCDLPQQLRGVIRNAQARGAAVSGGI